MTEHLEDSDQSLATSQVPMYVGIGLIAVSVVGIVATLLLTDAPKPRVVARPVDTGVQAATPRSGQGEEAADAEQVAVASVGSQDPALAAAADESASSDPDASPSAAADPAGLETAQPAPAAGPAAVTPRVPAPPVSPGTESGAGSPPPPEPSSVTTAEVAGDPGNTVEALRTAERIGILEGLRRDVEQHLNQFRADLRNRPTPTLLDFHARRFAATLGTAGDLHQSWLGQYQQELAAAAPEAKVGGGGFILFMLGAAESCESGGERVARRADPTVLAAWLSVIDLLREYRELLIEEAPDRIVALRNPTRNAAAERLAKEYRKQILAIEVPRAYTAAKPITLGTMGSSSRLDSERTKVRAEIRAAEQAARQAPPAPPPPADAPGTAPPPPPPSGEPGTPAPQRTDP